MIKNKNMINDDELELISGGKSTEEWGKNEELRQSYYKKVLKICDKLRLKDSQFNLDFLSKIIWYYDIPDADIEAFIKAHCVYSQDLN